jgi:phenylalanyl-tRNA synthetase beta chain
MAISMKTSPKWLQNFFEESLPSAEELGDALTFHSCEIEEITPNYIDVNVLPDRAAYCLCHRGVAYELSAILNLPMNDPLRTPLVDFPSTEEVTVTIEDPAKCSKYIAALIRGVKVGPSPEWLREALESVGQRSINNVVDATNYVMLNIGQPLHACDATRLVQKDGVFSIKVRSSIEGEKITTLSGDDFVLPEGILLITDANASEQGTPVGIAGVKGGKAAEISATTKDILLEAANFDGTLVRKTSQRLKLWTDASQRFQNKPSPLLTEYGMRDVIKLILDIAGGELVGVTKVSSEIAEAEAAPVSVSLSRINSILGSAFETTEIEKALERLGFPYTSENGLFTVAPPFERRDIVIPEDLVEEVGRIIGYEQIAPLPMPPLAVVPDQHRYRGIERIKDFLVERGFIELSTQTFAVSGEIMLANPLDQTKPALRTSLVENMKDALVRATNFAPRVLGPATEVKLFEIGTIFKKDGEHLSLVLGYKQLSGKQSATLLPEVVSQLEQELIGVFATKPTIETDIAEAILTDTNLETLGNYEPHKVTLGAYKPFSQYPFALRDIAVWTPEKTEESEVANLIIKEAGTLLARIDLFDRFSKEVDGKERISYAFRLVFESFERTLSDEDLNPLMEKITATLNAQDGWEVR